MNHQKLAEAGPAGTAAPDYTDCPERGLAIYSEAFQKVFEYLYTNQIPGDVAEFGTYRGFTAGVIAKMMRFFNGRPRFSAQRGRRLLCYDSFEAFPESDSPVDRVSYEVNHTQSWAPGTGAAPAGTQDEVRDFLATILPEEGFAIVPGFYEQTLLTCPPDHDVALVHLDCDLYASTKLVLDHLVSRGALQDGSVIMCDDYNCNRARDDFGERRAMQETFACSESLYSCTEFFSYGWHGRAFFVHEKSQTG
ncbi:hypothetical protein FHR84_003511 [Actinopolyspora biskrensis]|uniref:Macrocin-O-methyltransferase (TylF) n=1 Tax=Actinopolyspora biskrensis TaxID=1470178 RepID=A0A852Z2C6_9ACTN|nr:TylF/MycF/NovP-related O-methyltransferase [Actinopolyspora biskrensis]NYH80162.1 hypothetical protein [Actinopolyspora biskrensis]